MESLEDCRIKETVETLTAQLNSGVWRRPTERFAIKEKIRYLQNNPQMSTVHLYKDDGIRRPFLRIDKWQRFPQKLDFSKPFRAVIGGTTGSGKSALVETLAVKSDQYNNGNGKIIDIFASRDFENLGWCRHEQLKNDILFVHADSTKISSQWEHKAVGQMTLADYEKHKVIISIPAFYPTQKEEWSSLKRLTNILWKRTHYDRNKVWFLGVREGTSLLYSRIGLGGNQGEAKSQFIYAIKEFRHAGIAMGIDILRYLALDVEVRSLADMLFMKACGLDGLPDNLNWLYKYYDLFIDLMAMPEWEFIIATKKGGVGNGTFQLPYWHKQTFEDFLTLFDIEIKHSNEGEINYAEEGNNHISDFEHVDIVRVRLAKGIGTTKLSNGGSWDVNGKIINLPKHSSKTVYRLVQAHNKDIEVSGSCAICKRLDQLELSKTKDPGIHA